MNAKIIIGFMTLVLLVLGIFAVSALVNYSYQDIPNNFNNLDKKNTNINMDQNGLNTRLNPETKIVTSTNVASTAIKVKYDSNVPCYQGLDQTRGISCYPKVSQEKGYCYKTITLPCGDSVQEIVPCNSAEDQVKTCGHMDELDQTRGFCYQTVKTTCGQTKQIIVDCNTPVDQTRTIPCDTSIEQVRSVCYKSNKNSC